MVTIFVTFPVGVANIGQKQCKKVWVYGSWCEEAVHARMPSTQQRACGSRSIGGCMHFLSSQEAEGTEC